MEGIREVVKAKNMAKNKVHVSKEHVCPLEGRSFDLRSGLFAYG